MADSRSCLHSSRSGVLLSLIVIGLVLLQILTRKLDVQRKSPGIARGDIVVVQSTLPERIGGWQCTGFQPAAPPNQLPAGQSWWTHTWQYDSETIRALVAFDQAGWKSWHELTVCYQAIGWKLTDRRVLQTGDDDVSTWPVVIANLEKPLQKATLVFSLFDQDGVPLASPFAGLPSDLETVADGTMTDNIVNRLTYQPDPPSALYLGGSTYDRVLQSQVLVQHSQDLSEQDLLSLLELHRAARTYLRSSWLAHHRSLSTGPDGRP